jgi:hypothetical protein
MTNDPLVLRALAPPETDPEMVRQAFAEDVAVMEREWGLPYCPRCGYPHEPGKCTR